MVIAILLCALLPLKSFGDPFGDESGDKRFVIESKKNNVNNDVPPVSAHPPPPSQILIPDSGPSGGPAAAPASQQSQQQPPSPMPVPLPSEEPPPRVPASEQAVPYRGSQLGVDPVRQQPAPLSQEQLEALNRAQDAKTNAIYQNSSRPHTKAGATDAAALGPGEENGAAAPPEVPVYVRYVFAGYEPAVTLEGKATQVANIRPFYTTNPKQGAATYRDALLQAGINPREYDLGDKTVKDLLAESLKQGFGGSSASVGGNNISINTRSEVNGSGNSKAINEKDKDKTKAAYNAPSAPLAKLPGAPDINDEVLARVGGKAMPKLPPLEALPMAKLARLPASLVEGGSPEAASASGSLHDASELLNQGKRRLLSSEKFESSAHLAKMAFGLFLAMASLIGALLWSIRGGKFWRSLFPRSAKVSRFVAPWRLSSRRGAETDRRRPDATKVHAVPDRFFQRRS